MLFRGRLLAAAVGFPVDCNRDVAAAAVRWSAGMRNLAESLTRFRPLQTVLYWIQFIIVVSLLTFPLTVYEGYSASTSTAF